MQSVLTHYLTGVRRRVGPRIASLLLLTLVGCLHRSPDLAVLAPLGDALANAPSGQDSQPEFLIIVDPLTASVLKNVEKSGHYRIAPSGTALFCPDNSEGPHGYEIRVRVNTIMGDSAVTTLQRICAGSQRLSFDETILVVRQGGVWKINEVLNRSVSIK